MTCAAVGLAAAFGCASAPRQDATVATVPATTASPAADVSPKPAGRIDQAAFTEDADGARLVLSADSPILYTSYEPRPDLLVLDLQGFGVSDKFVAPSASGEVVTAVKVEPMTELGKALTRISVTHRPGARYDVRSIGQGLAVAFEGTAVAAAEPAPAAASEPTPVETAALAAPAPAPAPVPAARVEIGHTLEEVIANPSGTGVAVALLGDGALAAKDFVLSNPPRIVVDLPGVKNEVRKRVVAVQSPTVSRVRISQFQTQPDPITRVVVDLTAPTSYRLQPDGERLALLVGDAAITAAIPAAPAPTPAPAPNPETAPATLAAEKLVPSERPVETVASAEPASVTRVAESAPPPAKPEEKPAPAPAAEPAAVPAVPEPAASAAAPAPAPAPMPETHAEKPAEKPAGAPRVEAPAPQPAAATSPAPAPAVSTVAAAPASAAQPPPAPAPAAAAPAPAKPSPRKGDKARSGKDDALFEAAAAVLDQQENARPEVGNFQPRTIAESQSQFTGEPISFDVKDADIKDVFRTISELTGLNIVVDPEVRGTVTVKLDNVPWDQALDLILKQNGLGYVLENNIMRIATTAKLQAEQSDRARLAEARQAAEPTRTVIKKLSYTKANDIVPVLKSIMSKRGDIVVDVRTNTLIIREIPTYMPAVLQLIDNLDTATPQVMIEARIVETTKSLGRSLGINWGINGVADAAHGNTTGLVFPNSGSVGFNVPLATGTPVGALRLANIINSFNLDIALSAAENQGLLKIISSPKVAALTNTPALIQSGVQIPVQTNVNNTTTVIYVDATLQLQVTPQITNEGTILLTLNVQKREPAVALNLALGQNVPLSIRQYRGEVLVRDGGTTVIGGIFQINDQDQNNMIPGLWKIPILGNLFKNKTRTEKHDELLIFVTPRILRS
jgi:type IV pilus assembly protein PilQ